MEKVAEDQGEGEGWEGVEADGEGFCGEDAGLDEGGDAEDVADGDYGNDGGA